MSPLGYCLLSWNLLVYTSAYLVFAQNDCDIFYIEQPQVQHSCDPYEGGLRLMCTVFGTEVLSDNLTINWYRLLLTNESISEPELVNEFTRGGAIFQNRRLMNSEFAPDTIVESDAGYYWCQVALKDQNNTLNSSYVPSQRFALLPPSVYQGYPPCSRRGSISEQSSVCAEDGVLLTPLFEWPLNTISTNNPTGFSVDTMEGIDPIILIVVTSILSLFIAALFFFLLVVTCKLVCKARRKSVIKEEVSGLTPARTTEIEQVPVTERSTSSSLTHSDLYLPETSYLQLQVSENAGYSEIVNNNSQDTMTENKLSVSSVPLPICHVLSLNSAHAITSNVPLLLTRSSKEQEEVAGSGRRVSMRESHEYQIIDPKKKEKAGVYMNHRKPPPSLPKNRAVKHPGAASQNTTPRIGTSHSAESLSPLSSNHMKTEDDSFTQTVNDSEVVSLSQADSRKDDVSSQFPTGAQCISNTAKGNNTAYFITNMKHQAQNTSCNKSEQRQYQSLIPNTKDYSSIYSSPQAIPSVLQFNSGMEYHYI